MWHDGVPREAAIEARAIADELGETDLRSLALQAQVVAAMAAGDLEAAELLTERDLGLLPAISDADHRAKAYQTAMQVAIALGRLQEARRRAGLVEDATAELSPHHRVHGISSIIAAEAAAGNWPAVRDLGPRAEALVAANRTPCGLNPGALLNVAIACAILGEHGESARLERDADALGMEGFGWMLDPWRVRLALERGDLGKVRRLLPTIPADAYMPTDSPRLIRLDALATLGERDAVEAEARQLLLAGTYMEPFALRALGWVRRDTTLLERAAARFDDMGLAWHASRGLAPRQT